MEIWMKNCCLWRLWFTLCVALICVALWSIEFLSNSEDIALEINIYRGSCVAVFVRAVWKKFCYSGWIQTPKQNELLRKFGRQPKVSSHKDPNAFLCSKMATQLTSTCEYVFPIKQGSITVCIYTLGHVLAETSIAKDAYVWQLHSWFH